MRIVKILVRNLIFMTRSMSKQLRKMFFFFFFFHRNDAQLYTIFLHFPYACNGENKFDRVEV